MVASAEAAVEEVLRRGVCFILIFYSVIMESFESDSSCSMVIKVSHPNKIAVGGHSYGAFMTANLLAHAPHLFCCGIARSGAYNRTLTPFGFQVSTLLILLLLLLVG